MMTPRCVVILTVVGAVGLGQSPQASGRRSEGRERRLERLESVRARVEGLLRNRPPATTPDRSPEERLGELLYQDTNLSLRRNQACATCHQLTPAIDPDTKKPLPAPGFVDPANIQQGTAVSAGSLPGRFGSLNTPSAGYAAFSPFFHWDATEGLYVGGQFWNGRANTLQEQAALPFLNPVEMAMPSQAAVIARVQERPVYRRLFKEVYDIDLDEIRTEGQGAHTSPAVTAAYAALARAIAAFEKTATFNRFTSKFDFYLAGVVDLSPAEQRGLEVFNGQANCAACHISEPGLAPDGSVQPPMFTDFTYDNIGLPRNVNIPGNPAPNPGLGGRPDVAARDASGADIGKHKVMSLRNIAVTAPYGHNGVFRTLEQITHFYNTRDVLGYVPDINAPGLGTLGWPPAEEPQNVNHDELGALGLTDDQERDVVTFMRTLTDGYPDWGKDARVPRGTPSPFASTPFPPFP